MPSANKTGYILEDFVSSILTSQYTIAMRNQF